MNIGRWIERRAAVAPERIAIVHGDRRVTYAEMHRRIGTLSAGLRERGVEYGSRVAWVGRNHPAFLETLFACAAIGAPFAPINHGLDDAAIASAIDELAPRLVVLGTDTPRGRSDDAEGVRVSSEGTWEAASRSSERFDDVMAVDEGPDPVDEGVGGDDVCVLPFTSGTTGVPKPATRPRPGSCSSEGRM
jgi:fatty-acyl-CoA synthase